MKKGGGATAPHYVRQGPRGNRGGSGRIKSFFGAPYFRGIPVYHAFGFSTLHMRKSAMCLRVAPQCANAPRAMPARFRTSAQTHPAECTKLREGCELECTRAQHLSVARPLAGQ